MEAPAGGDCGGLGTAGAGRCHLGSGEGGHWPANAGPAGGLGWALLGGWAEPAAHGCGGLAAGSGGNLATPPILTTHPCPTIPFDTRGWPLASCGCCCGSAAHSCPSSCLVPCQSTLVGEPAKQLEAPKPWRARAEGEGSEGGVAGALV